jgi:hypothetical protein
MVMVIRHTSNHIKHLRYGHRSVAREKNNDVAAGKSGSKTE